MGVPYSEDPSGGRVEPGLERTTNAGGKEQAYCSILNGGVKWYNKARVNSTEKIQ